MAVANADNVILGLGNKALSDDAIGIKVVRYIQKNRPNHADLHMIDSGHLRYELTAVLEYAQNLIVIYATKLDRPPGTITTFVGTNMDQFLKRPQRNANETALADMFDLVRLAHRLPHHRALITIEPKKISWGNRLSASMNKAIPQLAETALTLMSRWTGLPLQEPDSPGINDPAPTATQSPDS